MRALNALALAITFGCAGCIQYKPTDLAFKSVRAVDLYDQRELPPRANGQRVHRLMLKIEFTSRTNLTEFVSGWYNLGADTYFCDRPSEFARIGWPDVYWNGHNAWGGADEQTMIGEINAAAKSGSIVYYVFVAVAREAVVPSKPPLMAYDFAKEPVDLCTKVRGGSEAGLGYASNPVVVPKAAIATALKTLPPDLRGLAN